MSNLKKTPSYPIYWVIFCLTIGAFIIVTPSTLHASLYFIIHLSIGLFLNLHSHLVFPIYFNPYFCYFMYCFGLNYCFLNIQLLLIYILDIANILSPNEITNYYDSITMTFLAILLISFIFTILIYCKKINIISFKKYFLISCTIILFLVNYYSDFLCNVDFNSHKYCILSMSIFVLIFFVSIKIILFTYKKKDELSSIESRAVILSTLLIFNCSSFYIFFQYFSTTARVISQISTLVLLYFLYKITSGFSILSRLDELNSKLLLHKESNILLKKYLNTLSTSKDSISEQYEYLNAQYGQILSVYPDALFLLDENGIILHINEKAEYLLEVSSPNKILHHPITDFIRSNDSIYIKSLIRNILDGKHHQLTTLSQVLTIRNNWKDVEILLTLSSNTSCPQQVIVSIKDISYRAYTSDLEQQVTLEKLKVEFFSTLSHELKTPVNVIYSASQLQSQMIQDQDLSKIPVYNQMISINCLRLLKLINNILDLNRVDSNYFQVSSRTINIVSATEDILNSTLPYAEKKNISLIFDTDEEEIYSSIDPDMLERILLNLFSNAIKYSHTNGHLKVSVSHFNQFVRIAIADDGIGIPTSAHQHIFHRFSRAENGLTRTNEGAGIGLSLVKSFVELNGGSIDFNSIENQGTEFMIYFPCLGLEEPENSTTYTNFSNSDKVEMEFSDIFS